MHDVANIVAKKTAWCGLMAERSPIRRVRSTVCMLHAGRLMVA